MKKLLENVPKETLGQLPEVIFYAFQKALLETFVKELLKKMFWKLLETLPKELLKETTRDITEGIPEGNSIPLDKVFLEEF